MLSKVTKGLNKTLQVKKKSMQKLKLKKLCWREQKLHCDCVKSGASSGANSANKIKYTNENTLQFNPLQHAPQFINNQQSSGWYNYLLPFEHFKPFVVSRCAILYNFSTCG